MGSEMCIRDRSGCFVSEIILELFDEVDSLKVGGDFLVEDDDFSHD